MFPSSQYLLILQPHQSLCDQVQAVKKKFAEDYDCPAAARGKPNITLVRFQQYEMMERRIARRLAWITAHRPVFGMELQGFGSFPTHSIFLNVATQSQFTELVRALRPIQQLLKMDNDHKPHFITDPYITIARKLLPWQYEKGWLELSNTHFSGRFVADHLLLLRKRETDPFYTTLHRFNLLNQKEDVLVQGQMFAD